MAIPTPQTKRVARLCAALPPNVADEVVGIVRDLETTLSGVRAGRDLLVNQLEQSRPGDPFPADDGEVYVPGHASELPGGIRPGAYRSPNGELWWAAWIRPSENGDPDEVFLLGQNARAYSSKEEAAAYAAGS